ncbi:MAG: calcium-translocating P-type ATPase, SERCA-type [Elainellaceae cyanobacterium]
MSKSNFREGASSHSVSEVLDQVSVHVKDGLSGSEVKRRQQEYGENRLQQTKRRSAWQILIEQFKSLIIAILAVAAVLSFAFQEWIEGIAVLIAILLNTVIGFVTELRAVRSMESLQELSKTYAKVRRAGQVSEIPSVELVPGDIVLFEGGDLIPADLRVIEASKLQIDESALTGESVPVSKTTEPIKGDVSLAEQTNMAFSGTAITRGSGEGVVVATGMDTELGRISTLTSEAEQEVTPLEKRLDQLGRRLIWVTLAIAAFVAIAGILGGREIAFMVKIAIALAVGAVPEGLPIVATVALARGMRRMAKRHALINRLSAVETLGATSIICTDKTGTLTENQMTMTELAIASGRVQISGEALQTKGEFTQDQQPIDPNQDSALRKALEVSVLCNNATLPRSQTDKVIGDPMEVALLVAGAKAGIDRTELLQKLPEVQEVAFESETKMMTTIHQQDQHYFFAVKGAPDSVLPVCSRVLTSDGEQEMQESDRKTWQEQNQHMAEQGLRVLALAYKTADRPDVEPYKQLTLLGIVGLVDPPRQEVKQSLQECHDAGIRVIMVTGDQEVTARNVGLAVGLVDERNAQALPGKELQKAEHLSHEDQHRLQEVSIFSRVSPEQKLNLIALHQKHGAIVAMTGDGVNDAPALKKADIGIAMGQRGTQVAKEAADMVLQDDAFATIVAAVEQGRAIFRNIRKFTVYLLSGNVGEIIAVAFASLINMPLPLLPLQILFINAVNDVFPALALGVGEGSPLLMEKPPRKSAEPIITKRHWWTIASYGLLIAVSVLGVFAFALYRLGLEERQAVTISFLALAFGRLWHVFNMRDRGSNLLRNEITTNPYIWGALLLCTGLLLAAVYIPILATALQVEPPTLQGWGLIIVGSLIPLIAGQIWLSISAHSKQSE